MTQIKSLPAGTTFTIQETIYGGVKRRYEITGKTKDAGNLLVKIVEGMKPYSNVTHAYIDEVGLGTMTEAYDIVYPAGYTQAGGLGGIVGGAATIVKPIETKQKTLTEVLSNASNADRSRIDVEIAKYLNTTQADADRYYQMMIGKMTPQTVQDGLNFAVIMGTLLAGAGSVYSMLTATAAKEIGTIAAQQGVKEVAKNVATKGTIETIKTAVKANPLITIFAATEIPNLIVMTQFARNQAAQEAGTTFQQLNFKLSDYETALKDSGYSFNSAIKAKNYTTATSVLNTMQSTLDAYKKLIDENEATLREKNSYDNVFFLYTTYRDAIEANRGQLPTAAPTIPTTLPESIDVQITEVVDGDTVKVTTQDVNKIVYDVRILGINAPDKNLSVYWVKSLIEGVEKRYELKAADYKAANSFAVTNLWRAYVTLKIDPANKTDKYGRILAAVVYDQGKRNFAEDIVENGLAVPYFEGENKYVDKNAILTNATYAENAGIGLWATIAKQKPTTTTPTPTTPGEAAQLPKKTTSNFKIMIDSVPTRARLWIDGVYTKHTTPSDQKELKDDLYLLTVGKHKIRVEKGPAGKVQSAEQEITIIDGDNGSYLLTLK